MQVRPAADVSAAAQNRPTAAGPPRRLRLGSRLTVSVTLAVAALITLITFAGMRIAERQLDADLRETAEVTAFAVADDIELRPEPIAGESLVPVLQSFMSTAPDLRSITVFRATNGRPEMVVSTSVIAPAPVSLVQSVITHGETATAQPTADTLVVAVPIGAPAIKGAVAVAVSMGAVRRLQRAAGLVAFGGDAFAVLAIAALISLLGRLREQNQQLVRSYESVSRLRETAARAQQLAAVGQTMANVAHQIGTPLNLVSGHVQLLQNEISDPAIRRRLSIVEEQMDRVVAAVRGLLERARPQQGERQPVRLAPVIVRIGDAMRARLSTSGVALDLRIQDHLGAVAADESQLELALLNLVTNALDAMPSGGRLAISGTNANGHVRIEVRDTGSGIDPDVLPRIFEPWVTTKPPGRGTGLGLSITHDLITSLGGTIAVSTVAGKGTTFTIELPAAQPGVEVV